VAATFTSPTGRHGSGRRSRLSRQQDLDLKQTYYEDNAMSQRIIIEYQSGAGWDNFPICLAATVADIDIFREALANVAKAAHEAAHGRNVTLDVDGIVLDEFPLKQFLEDPGIVEILDLNDWFSQKEIESSSQERIDRLCGVSHATS
jgi:hypothetical protein